MREDRTALSIQQLAVHSVRFTFRSDAITMKLFLVGFFLTATCFAQTTPAKPRTVIHAAKMFDAKAGRVLTNQYIVIEGDKIVSVGGTAPAGAKAIELPN